MSEQRTAEWYEKRRGKITASAISKTMMKSTTAGYRNYMAEKVAEVLTGCCAESFTSGPMQWGIDHEDDARLCYSFITGNEVEQVDFVDHHSMENCGASPDGLIGTDGLVEIKCPNTATHIDYLTKRKVPKDYNDQMQWQMACTGRQWCDFASYDPRMPENLQLCIIRVERDDALILSMQMYADVFLKEVAEMVAKLEGIAQ